MTETRQKAAVERRDSPEPRFPSWPERLTQLGTGHIAETTPNPGQQHRRDLIADLIVGRR